MSDNKTPMGWSGPGFMWRWADGRSATHLFRRPMTPAPVSQADAPDVGEEES